MDAKYAIDKADFLNPNGNLKIYRFARRIKNEGAGSDELLAVSLNPKPVKVAHSKATGEAAISNGMLGGDIIHLRAGDGFVPHTHPGDHLLIILGGSGTVTYGGKIYPTEAGQIFMIEGSVPHAVGAITDHVILAVGSPHKPIDALDRMTPLEYEAVTTEISELHCLICDVRAKVPFRLHQVGCSHCPCDQCNL